MNKATQLLASGAAFIVGNIMFSGSFYQFQQRILVSPYSTQQAIQVKDVPQPYRGLLQFGGSAIALSSAIFGGLKVKKVIMEKPNYQPPIPEFSPESSLESPELEWNESPPGWNESALVSPQTLLQSDSPPRTPNPLQSMSSPPPDLLGEVAEYLVSQNGGHLLLPATTGSGKTSTILALMERMVLIQPDTVFHVIDPKGTIWGGLDQKNIIEIDLVNPNDGIQNVLELFENLKQELQLRKRIRKARVEAGQDYKINPIIVIIDEYLALLQAARECSTRRLEELISRTLETLAFFAREDNIKLVIISQSHLVSQLGFNTAARNQFALLCQGIGANSQSFKPIVMALSSDEFKNTNLLQQFYRLAAKFPNRPVAFSSLGATGRVEVLPDLTGIKMRRIFSPPPPASESEMPEPEMPEPEVTEPGGLTYLKTWLTENGISMEDLSNG